MNETMSSYPAGFAVKFFRQKESKVSQMPTVELANGILTIPTFIHLDDDVAEGEEQKYVYIPVEVLYRGQSCYKGESTEYADCLVQCYAEIRKFFYGDDYMQRELVDDELWEAHRIAVKEAFPRPDGRIVYKYSVYKIQEKLISLHAWDAAREYLVQNGLMDKLTVIGNVRSDNEYFVQHYPVVKAALNQLLPGVDIDAELRTCLMD